MEAHLIVAALRRHRLIAALLLLLVALTCAVVTNVAFMLAQRLTELHLPSGIDENQVLLIRSTSLDRGVDQVAMHRADVDALEAITGVEDVSAGENFPLGQGDMTEGTCTSADALMAAAAANAIVGSCAAPSIYVGAPSLVQTLGLHLVAGRDFRPDEFVTGDKQDPPVVIITRELASKLFPGQSALGKLLYSDPNQPMRVIGVVNDVLRPSVYGQGRNYQVMIWPQRPDGASVTYVLRVRTADRAAILKSATTTLYRLTGDRVLDHVETFTAVRRAYFHATSTMIGLLLAAALGLLFVAALGIAGLVNFWVQRRTRTIGIRRAVGATRVDILRYFLIENFLIVTGGVVLGAVLAIGLNLMLMRAYALPRLPLGYLAVGALLLWAVGQLSVLMPALSAARVSPVVAIRK